MSLKVRAAQPADGESVRRLLTAFGYAADALTHVDERLAGGQQEPRVLVAEEDGRVVGVASLNVSVVLERTAGTSGVGDEKPRKREHSTRVRARVDEERR